jgi:hypothetical protein
VTYLGLDLGAGFTRIGRIRLDGWLGPGGLPDVVTVQSALTYHSRGGLAIPVGYSADPPPGSARCDGFPALLGTALSGSRVAEWHGHTPAGVTRDFLRCLLEETTAGTDPLTGRDDAALAPVNLVVAAPPNAYPPDEEQRRDVGSEIRDALEALDWIPRRFIAAPVAALLWLRHRHPDLPAARRVLVIDVGAGAADFSLCTLAKGAIRVTDSVRVTGVAGTSAAGPPCPLAEQLITALAAVRRAGPPGTAANAAGDERVRWWRSFEAALADDAVRDRLDVVLQQAAALPHRHGNAMALRFGGLEVTANELFDATAPLARRLVAALGELLGRQQDPGWRGFRPGADTTDQVLLLGGLTVLYPLRAALLSSLGLDPDSAGRPAGPSTGVHWPAGRDLTDSVARGAVLLAAGLADPGDRYPHELRLVVHRQVRSAIVTERFTLAPPGSINLELGETRYLRRLDDDGGAGEYIEITVPPREHADELIRPASAPIPVEVVRREGPPAQAYFQPAPPPGPGRYWVAVRGGAEGPAVILQPSDGGRPLTYLLAELAETVPDRPAPTEVAG